MRTQAVLEALRSAGLACAPACSPPEHSAAKAPAAAAGRAPGGAAAAAPPAGAAPAPGRARRRARWRLVVAAGLLVAPFFPAANVLFPVGTFIGERLLYAPSVGFCLLAAGGLARLAGPHLPRLLLLWAPAGPGAPHMLIYAGTLCTEEKARLFTSRPWPNRTCCSWLVSVPPVRMSRPFMRRVASRNWQQPAARSTAAERAPHRQRRGLARRRAPAGARARRGGAGGRAAGGVCGAHLPAQLGLGD